MSSPTDDLMAGDLCVPEKAGKRPVVIICHSFMAFKDWGFFPYLAREIAERGYCSLTFNFSHNGVRGHGRRITELGKFERNTFSRELSDLKSVIDAVSQPSFGRGSVDTDRIILLGHSRGGGIAIVHSAQDKRIHALVTLSAISTLDRWTLHQKNQWRSDGHYHLSRDAQTIPLRLGIDLLDDLELNGERLDICRAASAITVPWLILHGMADVTVQPREGELLYKHARKTNTEFHLLEKVGHLYNATSADEDDYKTLNNIIVIITRWLHRNS